jgi:hypothetical protein
MLQACHYFQAKIGLSEENLTKVAKVFVQGPKTPLRKTSNEVEISRDNINVRVFISEYKVLGSSHATCFGR